MKNTLIGILLIVSAGSLTFGFIQKGRLEESKKVCAEESKSLVEQAVLAQKEAEEFRKMAELAQTEAQVQRTICEEQLKALKK